MSLFTRTKVKPPTQFSVTYSASGGFAVNLRWTPIQGGQPTSYYVVYRDGAEIATGLLSASYRDATAVEGADYAYQIATVNVNEVEGEPTSSVPVSLPHFPVWSDGWSLSIQQNTTGTVVGRCTDPDGGSLTYSKGTAGTAPSTVTVAGNGTVTVAATPAAGYTLELVADNGNLISKTTVPLTVTASLSVPGVPENFAAQAVSASRIDLSWDPPSSGSAPTGYTLQRSLTGTGGWSAVEEYASPATSVSDSGLSAGTTYYYRVLASNAAGPSGYATTSEATNPSSGTNHNVNTSTSNFNASGVEPGDTITILRGTGTRGPLTITGAVGTAANPITVVNEAGGLLTISGASTWLLAFDGCQYVNAVFDNSMTTEQGISYGLLVTPTSESSGVTAFVKYLGLCKYITLSNFKIDGKATTFTSAGTPIGISNHQTAVPRSSQWWEGHVIENFYLRRIKGEGIYGGPNFYSNSLAMRNMKIRYGVIEDTGRDGIQVKSWLEHGSGTRNEIHDIICRRVGRNTGSGESGQLFGVSNVDGCCDIYNVEVYESGGTGIQYFCQNVNSGTTYGSYGPYSTFPGKIYNCVVARAGATATAASGNGISVGATGSGNVKPAVSVYSCTAVNCSDAEINLGSQAHSSSSIKNCLCPGGAISDGPGSSSGNITSGTVAGTFTQPASDIYKLQAHTSSPATGVAGTDYSTHDIEGTARAPTPDVGAYEF